MFEVQNAIYRMGTETQTHQPKGYGIPVEPANVMRAEGITLPRLMAELRQSGRATPGQEIVQYKRFRFALWTYQLKQVKG